MIQLTNISNDANQKITQDLVGLGLSGSVSITLKYNFRFLRWVADIERLNSNGVAYFTRNGTFLTPNVPLLYAFNAIDFDIICTTSNDFAPFDIDDFVSGSANGDNYGLFIVTKEEAANYYTV